MKHFLKQYHIKKQQGFTLIETIVAIFILSLTIGALLSLAAGGFYSVRYSRNQLVAENLIQESIEYIRNSRDTALQQNVLWTDWLTTLNVDTNGATAPYGSSTQGCFSTNGCIVDPYTSGVKVRACGASCPTILFFPNQSFYGYSGATYPFSDSGAYATTYVRTISIIVSPSDSNQATITARISWQNGNTTKTTTQSVVMTNWRP